MKQLPFGIIFGGTLPAVAVLSSTKTTISGTVTQFNAWIAEINTNFANYGYASTPNLPLLPTIPTPGSTAPNGIAYFQSTPPGGTSLGSGPASSFLLIDAFTSNGYSDPSGALDTLTADATLLSLAIARASLSTAAPVAITVQPTNQSIAHNAAGAIALTATGTGALFTWLVNLPNTTGFQLCTTADGVLSTINTASLTITNPPLAKYNGAKFACIVDSASGGQRLWSTVVTLTVT
jgi:hypothetical protein